MQYINPYSILNIEDSADINKIKKAKKVLFAEIELGDGNFIEYKDIKVTKTDCIRIFEEISDPVKNQFHQYIYNDPKLEAFLTNADVALFDSCEFKIQYKQEDFIDFISPYFVYQYNKVYTKIFNNINIIAQSVTNPNVKDISILNNVPINLRLEYQDQMFKNVYSQLRRDFQKLKHIVDIVRDETGEYNEENIYDAYSFAKSHFNSNIINILPNYFNSLKRGIVNNIRELSINIFNIFSDVDLSINILDLAIKIEIDSDVQERLNNDYKQLQDIKRENKEIEKYESILEKYADVIVYIKDLISKTNNRSIILSQVSERFEKLNIDTKELNSLPDSLIQIRTNVAYSIRNLAVAVWNTYSSKCAISILYVAKNINTDTESQAIISSDMNTLNKNLFGNKDNTQSSSSNIGIYIFIIIAFFAIINYFTNGDDNNKEIEKHKTQINNTSPKTYNKNPFSTYKGNKLKNGDSPYDEYFGKGKYSKKHKNWIEIKSGKYLDVVVLLINAKTNKVVRNEYIQANSIFKMTNIFNGSYYIKVFYGKDWNPNKTFDKGRIKGGFMTSANFAVFSSKEDIFHLLDDEYKYSTLKINLQSSTTGNMSQDYISENDFFK